MTAVGDERATSYEGNNPDLVRAVAPLEKGHPFAEPSIVDLLKQDYQELAAIEHVFIPVLGYERVGLTVKYGLPENGKQLDNIARKVMQVEKDDYLRNLFIGMDVMIALCQGLYVKPPSMDLPDDVMLDPEELGEPVMFDDRLAKYIPSEAPNPGEPPSARRVVKQLFAKNEMAIINHAEKLQRWLQNTKADLSMEFWQTGGNR